MLFRSNTQTGLKIHFFFSFKSTQCFQNMLLYQFIHLSQSILGVRKNFHSVHSSGVYTYFFFFDKAFASRSINLFFQWKARSYFFSKTCWLLVNQNIFIYFYYYLLLFDKVDICDHIYFFPFLKSRANEGTHELPTSNHKVTGKNAMISRNEKQWQNNWEP